mmetsp:Transcript_5799/g.10134  ORF Transcript_5799/g.10134 Transcript_5799/m.10134 type:complete len:174 (+) Transcript_5799:140-661(+)
MLRICAECTNLLDSCEFSSNQWKKGAGSSRCWDCVSRTVQCSICSRSFTSQNNLRQHMKTHVARSIPCPVCGDKKKFRNAANAVAHVESGYCSGCKGQQNARQQIYNYARINAPQLTTNLIEGAQGGYGRVPQKPYRCQFCARNFAHLSALLNHERDAHRNNRPIQQITGGYY